MAKRKYDLDGDGVISDSDMDKKQRILQIENNAQSLQPLKVAYIAEDSEVKRKKLPVVFERELKNHALLPELILLKLEFQLQ